MADEKPRASGGRIASLFVLGALAVAAVGFLTGTSHETAAGVGYQPVRPAPATRVIRAPSQPDLRSARWGPNASMYDSAIANVGPLAAVVGPMPPRDDEARELALGARVGRRAYNGAPPTIPHPIDQTQAPNCLACHERGMQVAGKLAPVMSHRRYDSCTQCHVPALPPFPLVGEPGVENLFVGLGPGARGERAWPGAPPTVPHTSLMRESCDSCHGAGGAIGMRTPHPERASCVQCHAPSAFRDQRLPQVGVE